MKFQRAILAGLLLSPVLFFVLPPAWASIKHATTVPRLYQQVALYLIVGEVTEIDLDKRMFQVKVAETVKGKSPGEHVRVQIVQPQEVFKTVAKGQLVVIFAGESPQGFAAIHVANTWLLAQGLAEAKPPVWRVQQKHDQLQRNFPGSTKDLIRAVGEIKAGKATRP